MNKEAVLQLISEAIDKGAYISVHVGQFIEKEEGTWGKRNKEEALDFVTRFQEAIGGGEIETSSGTAADCVFVDNVQFRGAHSYFPYMEEDIQFEGEDEIA